MATIMVGRSYLAVALCLNIIGELAADLYFPRVSFVISLFGLVVLVGGWGLARLLIFPLLLLFLMIPLPDLITKALTIPLQLISSQLASRMLRLIGIPVLRQGNIIDLGVRQMQIVDACSGLRYILALLALGVIFCYFYQRKTLENYDVNDCFNSSDNFCQCHSSCGYGVISGLAGRVLACFFRMADLYFLLWNFCLGESILNRLSPPEIPE